jgi:import inner membrane translocase subunit TIM22
VHAVASSFLFVTNTTWQYRAKNDMVNPVLGGFVAGGILARNSGPRGALAGGAAFAAFSAAIDLFLRRETPEYATSLV